MPLLLKCTSCRGTGLIKTYRGVTYHCHLCEGTGERYYDAPRYYAVNSHRSNVSTGRPSPSAIMRKAVSGVKAGFASSKRWIFRLYSSISFRSG